MATAAERVAAGAAWLDANHPGWVDKIDLGELNLRHSCSCILGQQFGDYWDAPLLGNDPADIGKFEARAEALGFNIDLEDGTNSDYEPLEAEWRQLIVARRHPAMVGAGE